MDIDHFKNFNDTYGHLKGDECLQKVSMAIKASMRRPGDFVGRYGGEEFIVVLPGTDSKGACSVADTIRKGIEDLNIENKNSPSGNQVTISLGVATIANYKNASIQGFIDMADKALYQAKDGGRNRVICFPSEQSGPFEVKS